MNRMVCTLAGGCDHPHPPRHTPHQLNVADDTKHWETRIYPGERFTIPGGVPGDSGPNGTQLREGRFCFCLSGRRAVGVWW
jgi:hypothetical protein